MRTFEDKKETIKLKILKLEQDNLVKKESNSALVDQIKKIINMEVERNDYK